MKAYVAVRQEGERLVRESGIPSTFVRPWYVLGPGHWWPYAILPMYWIWGAFPSQRDTARRLYPVKVAQVVNAIVDAVEHPPPTFASSKPRRCARHATGRVLHRVTRDSGPTNFR
jgi:uncharacterized protein YbjT (DUF2867 family)